MRTSARLPTPFVDPGRPIRFRFDGREYTGYAGDTLASALLANGERVLGRSFKYHRPRGLLAAGVEESNVLVAVGEGASVDVNLRATEVELYDGLNARAVNCWPNARFDVGSVLRPIERFLPAGFYYKTMMWPDWGWFEQSIRRAAGLGRVSGVPDESTYAERFAHCEVLVVGSGPAGLATAQEAARRGDRVLLVEQEPRFGGQLLWGRCYVDDAVIEGGAARALASAQAEALRACGNVTLLPRTTAVGYFDHNCVALVQRLTDHLPIAQRSGVPRQRLWQVRAREVVLATGALERPLVFPGNDRPGVMLGSAVERYLHEFGVRPGRRAAVFTNNDRGYFTAVALQRAGLEVVAIIDSRTLCGAAASAAARDASLPVMADAVVVGTDGAPSLRSVSVRDSSGGHRHYAVDLLAVSGGWNPNLQLFSQSGGALEWSADEAQFRPGRPTQPLRVVGDAAGTSTGVQALWHVQAKGKAFVDFQNDVTVADIELAKRENYVSLEHLKRYTTLGMAPDQGKTSNVNALAIMASLTGRAPQDLGTVRSRFPVVPIALGSIAGAARREKFRPLRRLPLHAWHAARGAKFEEYGGWSRPAHYLRAQEMPTQAEQREALAVRNAAGLFDASPLGKIEVVGPDAATFLDRIYANTMSTLKVGRLRYGLMLSEHGVVIDDGVAARLGEDRFLVGTTSGGADRIALALEEWLQCEWPSLQVLVAPLTTSFSVLTLTGPKARDILRVVGVDFPLEAAAFPHMCFRDGQVGSIPARVSRVSFTGEMSFEISVPNSRALQLWEALMGAGQEFGITPVGIDAWMLLRTEKGYMHIGADTDGSTSPDDIGWGHVHKRDIDFVGRRALLRPENLRTDRHQFVGLEPIDGAELRVGKHLRASDAADGSEGYITSSGYSPTLHRWVALAMLRGGRARVGEVVRTVGGRPALARVTSPGSYDIAGDRLRE